MLDFSKIDDWSVIITQCFNIDERYLRKTAGPCPICGGSDRFRYDDKDGMGTWYCQQCGPGNGFTLIQKATELSKHEILTAMEQFVPKIPDGQQLPPPGIRPAEKELAPEEIAKRKGKLNKTWDFAKPLSGFDAVSKYLLSRVPRLNLSHLTNDFRNHTSLGYWEDAIVDENAISETQTRNSFKKPVFQGNFFAMLARIKDKNGKPINLHRTYLTAEGKKAPFKKIKKQMEGVAKLKGGAIRLNDVPQSRVLGIVEGIETGCAVLTAYRNQINVWSLINCRNMSIAEVPRDRFDKVIFFADHDRIDEKHGYRPGEHFAQLGVEKLRQEGFEVELRIPENEEEDFADVWEQVCAKKQLEALMAAQTPSSTRPKNLTAIRGFQQKQVASQELAVC